MNPPIYGDFKRYLAAKKSVDDRALNKDVWQTLKLALGGGSPESPLHILEIGAGIGTMIERMLEWELIQHAVYTVLDSQVENIAAIPGRLSSWASQHGGNLTPTPDRTYLLEHEGRQVLLDLEAVDLFDFLAPGQPAEWDLLVAHAFLDLIDIPSTLPGFLRLLKPDGCFYLTINFDAGTIFEPLVDHHLDRRIPELYHRTMDERLTRGRQSGDSQAGRHLFENIRLAGGELLASGASDWIVYPGPNGYPLDEAYFLHFIIQTIGNALQGRPELDPASLHSWLDARHAQIERKRLIYIAHQLDFFGRVVDPGERSR
jgi:SAM-dependent methyltransferase